MDHFKGRGNIILIAVGLVLLVYAGRFFQIQVISEDYQQRAKKNLVKSLDIIPPRGDILDRRGKSYVSNRPLFNMLITPGELYIPDTSILRRQLGLSQEEVDLRIAKAREYSSRKESIFARNIEPEEYAILRELTWDFQGVSFSVSNKRHYDIPAGANLLGYIGEVDPAELKASEGKLKMGELIGKSGIERSHDKILRGKRGIHKVLTDKHNRVVGSYASGKFDTPAERGHDIMVSVDGVLQQFGEELMVNKLGSIVAIEPSSGQILAFVSAPTFDPGLLTGSKLAKNWKLLREDSLKPLFNRPLMAAYPPGSIFKIALAAAALNEGVITPNTSYSCGGGFSRNHGKPGCRMHVTPLKLELAIKHSCNSYFSATYMDFLEHPKFEDINQAFDKWHEYMSMMGVGRKLNVDLPYEKSGLLPSSGMYDKWYNQGNWHWGALTVISNAIGQGEILMTPLQMANMVTIVANRGWYYEPHFLVGERIDVDLDKVQYPRIETGIASRHFEFIAGAMEKVVSSGTGRRAKLNGIEVCGKTGTVENPHGEDHAVFVGFAPKDNPQIAIAVVIENAGGGGRWAAPLGSLMMEKYLRKKIVDKKFEYQRILKANFINPVGK